jgi:hypothetical protein
MREKKRRYVRCIDQKSNSYVKMKKRRNKKLYTILFIVIERGDEEEKRGI